MENASLTDPRIVLRTTVQVAYGTDLDALMPRLRAAVAQVPRVLSDPMPAVLLSGFAADGLELAVMFWIKDPENGEGNVRSDVNLAILRTLNEAGVEAKEATLTAQDLEAADEIFSTGNYGKVVPCTRYEGRELNTGPVAQLAKRRYFEWAATTSID